MRVANAGAAEGDSPVTSSTLIADVIGNPLLEDYGRFLFPIAFNPPWPGDTLADVAGLLTWRSFVNTDTTVDVVGDLLGRRERGEVVFHSIYTEAEKASDPTLRDTGIFVSSAQGSTAGARGWPCAARAVVSPTRAPSTTRCRTPCGSPATATRPSHCNTARIFAAVARTWPGPSPSSTPAPTSSTWTPPATRCGAAPRERAWPQPSVPTVPLDSEVATCPVPAPSSCSTPGTRRSPGRNRLPTPASARLTGSSPGAPCRRAPTPSRPRGRRRSSTPTTVCPTASGSASAPPPRAGSKTPPPSGRSRSTLPAQPPLIPRRARG